MAEREWPRKKYVRCARHNVFVQWEPDQPQPTTPCGDRLTAFDYIVPQFGLMTDRNKPERPTSRPSRPFTTRPYFVGPTGPHRGTLEIPATASLITVRKASPGKMVVLCEGRRREGFHICVECGAGFRAKRKSHDNPYGEPCRGKLNVVSLGHELETDVLQLQFREAPPGVTDPTWFAYSLAFALVEGAADLLDVPSSDLSATVTHTSENVVPPIILYDNVPGGAGLVARLEMEPALQECLTAARTRVSGACGCDEDTSCYGCLRNFRNQFAHEHLRRGPVSDYLAQLLARWR